MSLRDYFAAKAMQSIIIADQGSETTVQADAEYAYLWADVMMTVRQTSLHLRQTG